MKIRDLSGKWVSINKTNYEEYLGETLCQLGESVGCIKTDDPNAAEILKTSVIGVDDTHSYHYFMMTLGANKNKTSYIINGHAYTILLKGETPLIIDEHLSENLPIFSLSTLTDAQVKDSSAGSPGFLELDYNLLASEFFGMYSYARYNDEVYYFHPIKLRWLKLATYDDYNILISMQNRNYVQREKRQIMDSMQIYLDGLENRTLNKDLLLFKNNVVLNVVTNEVSQFDGSQFILNSLNANWYEDPSEIPPADYYLTKVLRDLTGLNIYKTDVEEKRLADLLVYTGYILSDMQKQNGLMMFGKSQNGKSTYAGLLTHIKGSGFMPEVAPLQNDAHYTSGFFNERILFFDELKPSMMSEKFVSVFNKLLGNQKLSVREMNKPPRTVNTNFTTIITVNELSPLFVSYRALLRRVKIMNSTFPVQTNLPPHINLNDELTKQDNMDWLANTSIRAFQKNDYRIDNLFTADIAYWIYQLNPIAKEYLNLLIKEEYINEKLELIVDEDTFKIEQSQLRDVHKQLGYTGSVETFDEQMNIVFQFVLGFSDMSCINGGITWR